MKFLLCSLFLFSISTLSFSQDFPIKVLNPIEVSSELSNSPKEIEGLQWNRWTSKNFVVLSTNDDYSKYLNNHLELVKTWTLVRWGLSDIDFSVPCKFICIDDKVLFEKLFKINKTKVEIRKDSQGKIKETVVFLLANDIPSNCVPVPLTEVSLVEFSQRYNSELSFWTYRGIPLLNGSLNQIREEIIRLKSPIENNTPIYFSQSILNMTEEEYKKLSDDQKQLYDSSAVAFCLMIRKEFGQEKFHHLMKDSFSKKEQSIVEATKFSSYDEFDSSFKKYMKDLSKDVYDKKTPNKYLQIFEPED